VSRDNNSNGRRDDAVAYQLRPYVGDVREKTFPTERAAYDEVRNRWPDAVGSLNTSEDDKKLYVIVWRTPEAQARYDAPVCLVGKDDPDPIFDSQLWREGPTT